MATYIIKGAGFDVGADFWRASADLPIELAEGEFAKPRHVIGYIAGDMSAPVQFMRQARVRVHVQRRFVAEY